MGRIAAPYGVKGWIKVLPLTAETETLLGYSQWWVRRRGSETWQAHAVASGRRHGATLLAQIDGPVDREAAALLTGADIGVPRDELPAVGPGEFYWADLVGLDVVNRQDVLLGKVEAVQDFGAHPVLRVVAAGQGDAGAGAASTLRLIPFVPAYVDGVDVAAGRIVVDWQPDY
jgi:16S rRNA processing protein RimM